MRCVVAMFLIAYCEYSKRATARFFLNSARQLQRVEHADGGMGAIGGGHVAFWKSVKVG
jgi:hypothetical protein